MAGETYTPYMNLTLAGVGVTSGPQWATDVNASLTAVDSHNHSAGQGVPITPNGLSISSDLTIQANNLTNIRSARFTAQSSPLALATDLGCAYVSGVDLYYNDISGNQIRITQSGSIVGTSGSISGLVSPATASYVAGSATFVWQSAVNTAANLDAGSVILRNITANSKGLTLSPPSAMAANYTITLPALPSVTSLMSIDTSGTIGTSIAPDNSTIVLSGSTLQVPTGGITATQIANATITATQIANATITPGKLVALGQQVSSSSGANSTLKPAKGAYITITNMTVTITTTGRPVMIMAQSAGVTNGALFAIENDDASDSLMEVGIFRDGTRISTVAFSLLTSTADDVFMAWPASSVSFFDTGATAGSHTYILKYNPNYTGTTNTTFVQNYMVLVAYEL